MEKIKNQIIKRKHKKPILVDTFFNKTNKPKPIVIFCHGYKGFKDWGAWDLVAKKFAEKGFFFIKFNFSHNGGTIEQPIDFPDLEAFGNNNYMKELDDLEIVINWISDNNTYKHETNLNNISLIGHSRGGGITIIKAEEDSRIKQVISLASVSDYKTRFLAGEAFKTWKTKNVFFVKNGRTKQNMPHYFQFFENFVANENRLTIKRAVSNLKIPHLIIHGNKDTSVLIAEADILKQWNTSSQLEIIENADHVFETSHPWKDKNLSSSMQKAVNIMLLFLSKTLKKES